VLYLNHSYFVVKDLVESAGVDKYAISKVLKNPQERDFIDIIHKNTFGRGSRVALVHPAYFWVGNYVTRQKFREYWWKRYYKNIDNPLFNSIRHDRIGNN